MKILMSAFCLLSLAGTLRAEETPESMAPIQSEEAPSARYNLGSGLTALDLEKPKGVGFNLTRDRQRVGLNGLFTSPIECENKATPAKSSSTGLTNLLGSGIKVDEYTSCIYIPQSSFVLERFGPVNCEASTRCQGYLTNKEIAKEVQQVLATIVAKDYGINSFNQNIDSMEKLEDLRRFAFDKFGIESKKCLGRFALKKENSCRMDLLVGAFEDYQADCQLSTGCYKYGNKESTGDYKKFKEEKKNPKDKSDFMRDFFSLRSDERVKKNLNEDEAMIEKLSSLVTSALFKKNNANQKLEMFLDEIEVDQQNRIKDPVLGLALGSVRDRTSLLKSGKIKGLLDLFAKKDLTKEEFAKGFDQFRKEHAEEILVKSKTCEETRSVQNICYEMTRLATGKKLPKKDSSSVEAVSSRKVIESDDLKKLKDLFGNKITNSQIETLLTARRCDDFELGRGVPRESKEEERKTLATDDSTYYSDGRRIASFIDVHPEKEVTFGEEAAKKVSGDAPVGEVKDFAPSADTAANAFSGQANPVANSSMFNDFYNPNQYGPIIDPKANSRDEGEKKESDSSGGEADSKKGTSAINDKINDLVKRLSAAEERVEKMKAENEAAEADRIKQKKLDEENALIKELRTQISDLKGQATKKEVVASSASATKVVEAPRAQTSSFSLPSSSSGNYSRGESYSSDSYDSASRAPAGGSASSQGAGSSRGTSQSQGPLLSSVSGSEGGRTSSLASGAVITTIDGLSTEKALQTISNRIIELNGVPFYIEEGGLVKEIIPVIKDGKVVLDEKGNPVYEKIVKGKIGDKKFAKAKDKNRAPAAITDAADLKRDQEEKLKRERAEYLKLKDLTSGALDKK